MHQLVIDLKRLIRVARLVVAMRVEIGAGAAGMATGIGVHTGTGALEGGSGPEQHFDAQSQKEEKDDNKSSNQDNNQCHK